MGESLSKMVAIIIAVFLLFIFPLINMFENQDNISRNLVFNETTKFVDSVRNLGYITPRMYEDFHKKINATGNTYKISLTHMHLIINPVYTDITDLSTFQDDAKANYKNIYTKKILNDLFPDSPTGDERYELNCGDYFLLEVFNKNKTMGTKVKELFLTVDLPDKNIIVNYGGMVKNENY
ncbi:MAG: hypothetical protein U9N10_02955 [Bacillota bacterium]|nr:hypothetical protein [Bacillota bacterium]